MSEVDPALVRVALAILLLLLGAWIALRLARWWRSWTGRRAQRRGTGAEARAWKLLERRGFRLLDVQVPGTMQLRVDGEVRSFRVCADAVVEGPGRRSDRRWVAEVKTGAAARVSCRSTRRQLLEYALCFDVEGVLLVDPDAGTIVSIELATDEARGHARL